MGSEFVTDSAAQTLTNKKLTSPKINSDTTITANGADINKLSGMTSSTAELNKLTGVTASTAEINYLNGVTSKHSNANKQYRKPISRYHKQNISLFTRRYFWSNIANH